MTWAPGILTSSDIKCLLLPVLYFERIVWILIDFIVDEYSQCWLKAATLAVFSQLSGLYFSYEVMIIINCYYYTYPCIQKNEITLAHLLYQSTVS